MTPPTRPFLEEIRARLEALRRDGLSRDLALPAGIDFCSNDYLGLSRHPRIREALRRATDEGAIAAPASRLLRGNTADHERLERRLARLKGTEAALLFPSGYQANLGVLTALLRRDDTALCDARNHASIIDGLRLSGCRIELFPHLDAGSLERKLAERRERGRTFIVTESLFSMDGDIAPLSRYAELADRHAAALIVDDAHATGVFGPDRGGGLVEEQDVESRAVAVVSTCGKALGISGGCVAGPAPLVEYLINKARPFIFTTAPPTIAVRAIDAALDVLEAEPGRRERVRALADRLRDLLRREALDCLRSEGPIVPVVLGRNETALRVAAAVRERGYDVRAIRPPAVPPGTARLRVSVHADHGEEEIDGLAAAIVESVAS